MKNPHLTIFILLFSLLPAALMAQSDCPDAIIVCGDNNYTNLNATGEGIQEINLANACTSVEHNSLWLKVLIKDGGTLGFVLTPENSDDIEVDFDFWIYGPNVSCNNLGPTIRCSTTNPANAELTYTITGMNDTETDLFEGPGEDGNAFINWMNVQDDEIYYLIIDRPHGASNFSLQWTGTATFHEVPMFLNPDNIPLDMVQCDDDGVDDSSDLFDLTIYEEMFMGAQTDAVITYHLSQNDMTIGSNPMATPEAFANTQNPQTIYLRITNPVTGCFSNQTFTVFITDDQPVGDPADLKLCDFDGNGRQWFDLAQNTNVIKDGNTNSVVAYFATEQDALDNINPIPVPYQNQTVYNQTIWARLDNTAGCFGHAVTSFEVTVLPMPQIVYEPKVVDFKYTTNSITIDIQNPPEDYEYSLDGVLYTDNRVFDGLYPGIYTIYIRSKNGCQLVSQVVPILNYPAFFTPNGDNMHELWNVFYINRFPDAKINIYDRYGKLINSYWGREAGWDGTYNGKNLPATDYWFELQFKTGRIIKGHFSLLR